MIHKGTVNLRRFILELNNLNNIRHADDTVVVAHSESKLKKIFDNVVKKRKIKRLPVNCNKIECIVVSKIDSCGL